MDLHGGRITETNTTTTSYTLFGIGIWSLVDSDREHFKDWDGIGK